MKCVIRVFPFRGCSLFHRVVVKNDTNSLQTIFVTIHTNTNITAVLCHTRVAIERTTWQHDKTSLLELANIITSKTYVTLKTQGADFILCFCWTLPDDSEIVSW